MRSGRARSGCKTGSTASDEKGEDEDGRSDEKPGPVGRFAEDPDRDEDPEGDGEVIEGGKQSGVGDEGGAAVPPEEAEAGGDDSEIKDDAPLGEIQSVRNGGGGEEVDTGKEGPAKKEQGVDFAVPDTWMEEFQPAVGDLSGSKAGIGPLHIEEADPPGGGFERVRLNDGRPGHGEGSRKKKGGAKGPALKEVAEEADVEGGEEGEEHDLVCLQVLEGAEEQAIHQPVLDGPQPEAKQQQSWRIASKA